MTVFLDLICTTPDRDPAVIAAHKADLPITEIAALSGLSRQWVARILKTADKQNGEQS